MNLIGISVGAMTAVSSVLYLMAGISAAAACVLFFALDIAKCWRRVFGKYRVRAGKRPDRVHPASDRESTVRGFSVSDRESTKRLLSCSTERICSLEPPEKDGATMPLGGVTGGEAGKSAAVPCPDYGRAQAPGDTVCMELIQDIVMMQDAAERTEIDQILSNHNLSEKRIN